jgi:hypothetical protein
VVAGVVGVVGGVWVAVEMVWPWVEVVVVGVDVVCSWVVVGVAAGPVVVLDPSPRTPPLQSLLASASTVWIPRLRSETSVELTEGGRPTTWAWRFAMAVSASPHSPLDTAAEAWWRLAVKAFDWLVESRPELAPQDARNAAASPSPPATRARET